MDTRQIPEIKNIGRVARILIPFLHIIRFIFPFLGALFCLGLVFTATGPTAVDHVFPNFAALGKMHVNLGMMSDGHLTIYEKLFVGTYIAILIALIYSGFSYGLKLAESFVKHEVFSANTSHFARNIAWVYTGYLVVSLLMSALSLALFSNWRNIELGGPFNSYLILCMVWLFAWVMQVGEALYTENKMTI